MKVRRELNLRLYEQKMDDQPLPRIPDQLSKYADIQSGNSEAVHRQLLAGMFTLPGNARVLSPVPLRNLVYHFVIEATRLADACMSGGLSHDEAYALTDIYIAKADACSSLDSVIRLYHEMCLDFSERMSEIKLFPTASPHIRKCIDYIFEHLGSDLSLKTLSDLTGLNPSYLSRLFARETGLSIHRFILAARTDTAQNLLKHSGLSSSKIAASLGFSSQSAFIAVFKRLTGLTPKAYQDRYR